MVVHKYELFWGGYWEEGKEEDKEGKGGKEVQMLFLASLFTNSGLCLESRTSRVKSPCE